jgi:hypothetical protein
MILIGSKRFCPRVLTWLGRSFGNVRKPVNAKIWERLKHEAKIQKII